VRCQYTRGRVFVPTASVVRLYFHGFYLSLLKASLPRSIEKAFSQIDEPKCQLAYCLLQLKSIEPLSNAFSAARSSHSYDLANPSRKYRLNHRPSFCPRNHVALRVMLMCQRYSTSLMAPCTTPISSCHWRDSTKDRRCINSTRTRQTVHHNLERCVLLNLGGQMTGRRLYQSIFGWASIFDTLLSSIWRTNGPGTESISRYKKLRFALQSDFLDQ
jgi:hypothetical protein